MSRILLHGALGKMGRMVTQMAAAEQGMDIVAGVDCFAAGASASYPLFETLGETSVQADVLVDYSRPEALGAILAFCKERHMPAVLCSTGYSAADRAAIEEAAREIPLFRSANMSVGANLLMDLSREAASVLSGFDIEIVETHHSAKVDAPSGTAMMLADAINQERFGEMDYVYDRHARRAARGNKEIGISALRGGTVTGEHSVHFFGQDEVVTLKHAAQSRAAFAKGTMRAAAFMCGRAVGLYDMQDVLLMQLAVTSLHCDEGQALLSIEGDYDVAQVLEHLARADIMVDMISQGPGNGLGITVPEAKLGKAMELLSCRGRADVCKLTLAGPGMGRQAGVAASALRGMGEAGIKPICITTSETSICLLVEHTAAGKAKIALRSALKL